jgi:hypothetical protein
MAAGCPEGGRYSAAAVDATEALAVLGVGEGTDLAGVRAAYRALVRAAHPDLAPGDDGAHARTARLTEAYEVVVAYVTEHGTTPPAPRPEPEPEPPPPPPWSPGPPSFAHGPVGTVDAHDEGTIALAAPVPEVWVALYEAAGRVGDIAYVDRRLGLLEIIVRFEGGPSCSVVMTLRGRSHDTEVLCSIESIEAAPAPPIAPVIHALVEQLRRL